MSPAFASSPSHEQWFQKVVEEAKHIKRGSSQASVLKLFSVETSKDNKTADLYVLKSCRAIRTYIILAYAGTTALFPELTPEEAKNPIVAAVPVLHLDCPTENFQLTDNEKWLISMINDYHAIKPGMPRSELLKKFRQDDGLNTIPSTRFVHKNCNLVKVDVNFDSHTKSSNDPIIENVSMLYADLPIVD
jgi:hypothetical protein